MTISTPVPITLVNQVSYSLNGSCSENGASIAGTIDVIAVSATCSGGSYTTAPVNMSSVADGTLTISLTITDNHANESAVVSRTVLKDTAEPSVAMNALAPVNISNVSSYALSGTCSENGEDVDLTVGSFTSSVS